MNRSKIALLGLLVMVLSACGGGPPPDANITIVMDEYTFEASDIELKVGQKVTFTLENVGQLDHELMIGRTVTSDSQGRPSGYAEDLFVIAGVMPELVGGGSIMDHGDGHSMEEMDHSDEADMEDMDHGDEEAADSADADEHDMDAMAGGVTMLFQPVGSDSSQVTFTVTEDMLGDWEMGCFQLDGVHYTSGMVGTLTVTN
jgi:uncharacterized cupredoxin-like copper-binding protein